MSIDMADMLAVTMLLAISAIQDLNAFLVLHLLMQAVSLLSFFCERSELRC
jgi:hypothetical protein